MYWVESMQQAASGQAALPSRVLELGQWDPSKFVCRIPSHFRALLHLDLDLPAEIDLAEIDLDLDLY